MTATNDNQKDFAPNLEAYLHNLSSLREVFPFTLVAAQAGMKRADQIFKSFLDDHADQTKTVEGSFQYSLDGKHYHRHKILKSKRERYRSASNLLPRNFLVSFVSEYDAFLGSLVKFIFIKRDEIFVTDKNLSYADLKSFSSVPEIKNFLIDKEIEGLLRDSHLDQFKWLEKRFGVCFTKDLDLIATFVELTERRNLFVHTNGIVSEQYLKNCRENGVSVDGVKMGDQLYASATYLDNAYKCLYEIGVKLTQILWRKIFPEEIDVADKNLNTTAYFLLLEENYSLSKAILSLLDAPSFKPYNETNRRMLLINYAQSSKHLNDNGTCKSKLASMDWSACSNDFQLCVAVLLENYKEAANRMISEGNKGEISENDYLEWPVFKFFRETDEFKSSFFEVFGKAPENIYQYETKLFLT